MQETHAAPVLTVADQAVDEMTEFVYRPDVADPELPADTLQFELVSGPPGAAIDPAAGDVHWSPGEPGGPGIFTCLDAGAPAGAAIHATTGAFTWTPAEVGADGTFRFRLAGEPGRSCVIERFEDPGAWAPWQTNTVDGDGWWSVTETLSAETSARYYGARLEP